MRHWQTALHRVMVVGSAVSSVTALVGCGGSVDPASLPSACQAAAGSLWLAGSVSAVHDGDTLTLQTPSGQETVRLQGIDAPELAQTDGGLSRQTLSQTVLHQPVRVAYTDRDRYDRVLGQVFTSSCEDSNLKLLDSGMAWFYTAYACDLDSARRTRYAVAQARAKALHLGLWRQSQPVAPWIYRNGEDPPAPVCVD